MAKRECLACSRPLRKGLAKKAHVLTAHGEVEIGLVCPRCITRGVFVVTPPATTVAPPCSQRGRHVASVCAACVERAVSAANAVLSTSSQSRTCDVCFNAHGGHWRCTLDKGHVGDHSAQPREVKS